jgi:hypothetical protein
VMVWLDAFVRMILQEKFLYWITITVAVVLTLSEEAMPSFRKEVCL